MSTLRKDPSAPLGILAAVVIYASSVSTNMLNFEVFVFNAGVVLTETLDRRNFFRVR